MATKTWAIVLVLCFTFLTATAQILLKIGSQNLVLNPLALITNYPLVMGVIVYFISAMLLIIALRGGDLSVLYPLIATSYIWVNLASPKIFGDVMNPEKWFGVFFILVGVTFIGKGSK